MKHDMMPDFDAYEHLVEITRFCHRADEHITTLLKNQQLLVETINNLRKDLELARRRVDFVEQAMKK